MDLCHCILSHCGQLGGVDPSHYQGEALSWFPVVGSGNDDAPYDDDDDGWDQEEWQDDTYEAGRLRKWEVRGRGAFLLRRLLLLLFSQSLKDFSEPFSSRSAHSREPHPLFSSSSSLFISFYRVRD
jgi:hypothetical protein